MQETHILAHTAVGRLICGCWFKKNLSKVRFQRMYNEQPLSLLAAAAESIYNFSVIGIGYYLLTKASAK